MTLRKRQQLGERKLPAPARRGRVPFEQALDSRRSVREFSDEPIGEAELSLLLWATQGITERREGLRAAPSAGALYPLELYVATSDGLLHYEPERHRLVLLAAHDLRPAMCRAALAQSAVRQAPAVFVITAVYARTVRKYGEVWSPRYVHMEVGHAAQNLLLQAVALGLAAVPIGAFHEADMHRILDLPADEEPLYLVPVGRPQRD